MTVNSGTMIFGKTSSGSVHSAGGVIAVNGGTLQLGGSGGDQIYNGAAAYNGTGPTVTVQGTGAFDLNGQSETIAQLAGNSTNATLTNSNNSTASVLTVYGNSTAQTYAGAVTGNLSLVVGGGGGSGGGTFSGAFGNTGSITFAASAGSNTTPFILSGSVNNSARSTIFPPARRRCRSPATSART